MVLVQDGGIQAHGIPVAPVTGQRPGLTESFAANRTPERLFLDVYIPGTHRAKGRTLRIEKKKFHGYGQFYVKQKNNI